MHKFKSYFTILAFFWLWICGFWAIFHGFATGEVAWFGLLVNAWALPVWMSLRYFRTDKYRGDQRESPAFAAVLTGLAIALLADNGRGQPLYLAIYNLFIFLIYLFHLSALHHPSMPAVDHRFPELTVTGRKAWSAEEYARRNNFDGLLLVFLRGSYCADSRALLAELQQLLPELQKRSVGVVLFAPHAMAEWRNSEWPGTALYQLEAEAPANRAFIAAGEKSPGLIPWLSTGIRPSQWLLDGQGFVLWRHLPDNYRTPGSAELLRSQLFRLDM